MINDISEPIFVCINFLQFFAKSEREIDEQTDGLGPVSRSTTLKRKCIRLNLVHSISHGYIPCMVVLPY